VWLVTDAGYHTVVGCALSRWRPWSPSSEGVDGNRGFEVLEPARSLPSGERCERWLLGLARSAAYPWFSRRPDPTATRLSMALSFARLFARANAFLFCALSCLATLRSQRTAQALALHWLRWTWEQWTPLCSRTPE
jgi:hypothetical protein